MWEVFYKLTSQKLNVDNGKE